MQVRTGLNYVYLIMYCVCANGCKPEFRCRVIVSCQIKILGWSDIYRALRLPQPWSVPFVPLGRGLSDV